MAFTDEGLIEVPGMASRWVRLATGVKVHYSTSGDNGPNVVLIHGGIAGSSGLAGWKAMAPIMGDNGLRVFCPDLPGYGLTEDPEHQYLHGPAGYVDFIHDFQTALCLEQFHISGNSLGAGISSNYTLAHPERIKSYALIGGGPSGDVNPELRAQVEATRVGERPRTDQFDRSPESLRKMLESIVYRKERLSDELIDMRTRAGNLSFEYQTLRYDLYPIGKLPADMDARLMTKGRFSQLTIPGIVLHGLQDNLSLVGFSYLSEDVTPNVQYFYPDECGHQGQSDQPEMFAQVFIEFFRDGQVTRKTADWAGVSKRRPELRQYVGEK